MHEADARVQLRVARQSLLKAGHPDAHQANPPTVVQIAQLLERSRFEAISFVNNDQVWCMWCLCHFRVRGAATSQSSDSPPQPTDVAIDGARGVDHAWRVQDRPPWP